MSYLAEKKMIPRLFFNMALCARQNAIIILGNSTENFTGIQNAQETVSFYEIPLAPGSHGATVGTAGGNIHNDYIRNNTLVALYKAVEVDDSLCHIDEFAAYHLQEEEEVSVLCRSTE